MKFLHVRVRTAMVVHGYDTDNKEIIETIAGESFVEKLVALERVKSISEKYLLVTSSHGRMMYWEYEGGFANLKLKLEQAGFLLS